MSKKISFLATSDKANKTGNQPEPAIKAIPTWYRKMLQVIPSDSGDKKLRIKSSDKTVKACPPFLDAMTVGYMIKTEFDLLISWENGVLKVEWPEGWSQVESHSYAQIVPEQVPEGFSSTPLKFMNAYSIVTPKGYSALFTHPLNRTDLPFYTLSGIVETDGYPVPVNFPFLIKKDFSGLIPAGTPIAQVIPIKRESWVHEIGKASQEKINDALLFVQHKFSRVYKSTWWVRKEYK